MIANSTSDLIWKMHQLGWTYVPKSKTAFFPTECGRIYLRTADRRDYSRLAATLRFAPSAHIACLAQFAADMKAASETAEAVAELLLSHLESNA